MSVIMNHTPDKPTPIKSDGDHTIEPDLLTINDVATHLSISPKAIREWEYAGKIAAVRLGRLVRIPRTELNRIMTEGVK